MKLIYIYKQLVHLAVLIKHVGFNEIKNLKVISYFLYLIGEISYLFGGMHAMLCSLEIITLYYYSL